MILKFKKYLFLSLLSLIICSSYVNAQTYMPKFSHVFHVDTVLAECIVCHPKALMSQEIEDKIFPVRGQCDSCHFEEIHPPPAGTGVCDMCHADTINSEHDGIYFNFPHPERDLLFSHVSHINEYNIQCLDCHEEQTMADKIACSKCHSVMALDSCFVCHIYKNVTLTDYYEHIKPAVFDLKQNYPNPFNPVTSIKYQIPKSAHVKLVIYNILGLKVRTLVDKGQLPGFYQVEWNGRNESGNQVSSGVYIYSITAGRFTKCRKMIFVK